MRKMHMHAGKMPKKMTHTRTKKLGKKVRMRGPGLSPRMKRNAGVGRDNDAYGNRQMRKHGMMC